MYTANIEKERSEDEHDADLSENSGAETSIKWSDTMANPMSRRGPRSTDIVEIVCFQTDLPWIFCQYHNRGWKKKRLEFSG